MSEHDSMASRMFPSMQPNPTARAVAPSVSESLRASETSATPGNESDVADRMFGSTASLLTTYGSAFRDATNRLCDATGMAKEERDAHIVDMTHTFHEAGIKADEASALHSVMVRHLGTPPDDETLKQWQTETRRQLRERYGDGAERRMAAVNNFLKERPTLSDMLDRSKVRDNPRFVLALAERADLLRIKPRTRR